MTKTKTYKHFIGVDVSKSTLDFSILQGQKFLFHKTIINDKPAILEFIKELKGLDKFMLAKAIFCFEHTGVYNNHLLSCLKKVKANVVVESALHIRNSLGTIRGKYDKVDSLRIAKYAYTNRDQHRLYLQKRDVVQTLAKLSTLRTRLVAVKTSLSNPVNEEGSFDTTKDKNLTKLLCEKSIASLSSDIKRVEEETLKAVLGDPRLKRLYEVITSVPTLGPVTAVQILVCTNEFLNISTAKQFACYAGVAPFRRDSGTVVTKAKVSHVANKRMKTLMHTCAIGSILCVPELKAYYQRKIAEGKPKMLVLNAVRFKVINRIFTCVKQDRCYEKSLNVLE